MMKRSTLIKPLLLAAALVTSIVPHSPPLLAADVIPEPGLVQVRKEYDAAYYAQDAGRLDRILAADYTLTEYDGQVKSRAEVIAIAKSSQMKLTVGQSDREGWRILGPTALATGRWREVGTDNGKELNGNYQYTTVYVKRDGHWLVAADQVTPILSKDARSSIEALHRRYMEAKGEADAEAIAEYWTKDALAMSPGEPILQGREAIKDSTRKYLKWVREEKIRIELVNLEVQEVGDWAYNIVQEKATKPDGSVVSDSRIMGIWKKEEGEWKLHRDIWHSAKPKKD